MKKVLNITFILLTICFMAGCRQPVGSIDSGKGNGNNGTGDLDFLWLVPGRFLYETDQWFVPEEDLQIMYAEGGAIHQLPYDTPGVVMEIIEHAHEADTPNIITVTNGVVKLATPGRHQIKVEYNGLISRYTIEVRGTYSGGGNEADIFDTIWL